MVLITQIKNKIIRKKKHIELLELSQEQFQLPSAELQ